MWVEIYPPAGTKFSWSLIIPTSERAMSPGLMHDFPPLPFFLSWPDRPCVGRLIISALLSATDYYQSSDAQVTMVTSFNKSVQPRNCEATRSCPTEKGNTLSRAAAYVTERGHSMQTSVKFCQRAAGPDSIPPALSPPGRGPSVDPNGSQDRQRSG